MEEWRRIKYVFQRSNEIIDFSDYYECSNLGRIRSIERISKNGHKLQNRILKPSAGNGGYLQVKLYKDGKKYMCLVNRIIAYNFQDYCGEWFKNAVVNHKIETEKQNNQVFNLEWVSMAENNAYGTRTERIGKSNSKEVNVYSEEGTFLFKCNSAVEAGKKTKNSPKRVSDVCTGKKISSKGYVFKYTDNTIDEKFRKSMTNNQKLSKPVSQYTLEGDYIKTFPSINEVERQTGYNRLLVSACCRGINSTSCGYIWKFAS